MIIQGSIKDYNGQYITITAPFNDTHKLIKQQLQDVEITLFDNRNISPDQRKKIYATFRDISDYTGYPDEETKEIMKGDYIARKGINHFSLSNVDMSTARDFLEHIIEFCIIHDIPTKDNLLERTADISRYIYACLMNKRCCICGKKAELHHENAIGQGRNRKEIMHIGMSALPLCRVHHTENHNLGKATFNQKYKVYGIKINKEIADKYKLKNKE